MSDGRADSMSEEIPAAADSCGRPSWWNGQQEPPGTEREVYLRSPWPRTAATPI